MIYRKPSGTTLYGIARSCRLIHRIRVTVYAVIDGIPHMGSRPLQQPLKILKFVFSQLLCPHFIDFSMAQAPAVTSVEKCAKGNTPHASV